MSPITTFKCGIPLPGLGPFNFPDGEVPIEPDVDTPKRPTPPPPNPGERPEPPPPPPPPPPSFGGGGIIDIKPIDDGDDGGGVGPTTPTVTIVWTPEVGITNEPVTFTIVAPPDIIKSTWSWGDGTPNDQVNTNSVEHVFTEPGVYNVTATIQYLTEGGEVEFFTAPPITLSVIDSGPPPPPPTMTVVWIPEVGTTNEPVTFTIIEPINIIESVWSWGDGTSNNYLNTNSVEHVFTESGLYNVTGSCQYLTEEGETAWLTAPPITLSVIDSSPPPTMVVEWTPEVGITNEPITFTITEPINIIESVWIWGDVSDPEHTFSNSTEHIYTEPGVYNLIITCNYLDEEGETQGLNKQIQLSVIDSGTGSGGGNAPKSLPPPPPSHGSIIPGKASDTVADQIYSERDSKNIYLSDLDSQTDEISKNPTGIYNEEINILAPGPSKAPEQVSNFRYDTTLFSTSINLGVEYLLKKNNLFETWDSTYTNQLTIQNVINSINPEVIKDLKRIQKEDGEYFSDYDIYTTIFTSLVRGTILNSDSDGINVQEIKDLADESENQNNPQVFVGGVDQITKEYAALGLLESDSTPIDPKSARGISINRLKNLKVLPTDINAKIPIIIDGVEHSRFVKVDGTILDDNPLAINDGYYLTINIGGVNKKLFCNTELSHTVFCSTESRAKAIKVLGGTNTREINVTSTYSQDLEGTTSLNLDESSPREDFYIFKLNASSISTTDALQSTLLKNTEAVYDLMDSSSTAGIDNVNNYIRNKGLYYKTMCINHDDNILDYMLAGSSFSYKQEDILYNAPKTSISITNFVRQLPYFIIIFPTNRFKYLPYQTKSTISDINVNNNSITRTLTFKTLLNYKKERRKFIEEKLGYPEGITKDVYGNEEIQNKIFFLNKDARVYKRGYRVNDEVTVGTSVSRTRSTFSLIRRILEDLDDTYVVDVQGTGKGLYYFDLFSRMTLTEFNKFKYLANYSMLLPRFANGAINNLRLFYPVEGAGSISLSLTGLKKQRIGKESRFPVINTTNDDRLIVPPIADKGSEIVARHPTTAEIATARARRRE